MYINEALEHRAKTPGSKQPLTSGSGPDVRLEKKFFGARREIGTDANTEAEFRQSKPGWPRDCMAGSAGKLA